MQFCNLEVGCMFSSIRKQTRPHASDQNQTTAVRHDRGTVTSQGPSDKANLHRHCPPHKQSKPRLTTDRWELACKCSAWTAASASASLWTFSLQRITFDYIGQRRQRWRHRSALKRLFDQSAWLRSVAAATNARCYAQGRNRSLFPARRYRFEEEAPTAESEYRTLMKRSTWRILILGLQITASVKSFARLARKDFLRLQPRSENVQRRHFRATAVRRSCEDWELQNGPNFHHVSKVSVRKLSIVPATWTFWEFQTSSVVSCKKMVTHPERLFWYRSSFRNFHHMFVLSNAPRLSSFLTPRSTTFSGIHLSSCETHYSGGGEKSARCDLLSRQFVTLHRFPSRNHASPIESLEIPQHERYFETPMLV